MSILLLSTDLMTASRIQAAGQSVEMGVTCISNAELLFQQATDSAIVVLDLATCGNDPAGIVRQIKLIEPAPRAILAFGPHVHESRLRAAADAGCDSVFSRGQFLGQATEILQKYR